MMAILVKGNDLRSGKKDQGSFTLLPVTGSTGVNGLSLCSWPRSEINFFRQALGGRAVAEPPISRGQSPRGICERRSRE